MWRLRVIAERGRLVTVLPQATPATTRSSSGSPRAPTQPAPEHRRQQPLARSSWPPRSGIAAQTPRNPRKERTSRRHRPPSPRRRETPAHQNKRCCPSPSSRPSSGRFTRERSQVRNPPRPCSIQAPRACLEFLIRGWASAARHNHSASGTARKAGPRHAIAGDPARPARGDACGPSCRRAPATCCGSRLLDN
jgi:hypothetical protein